jgi:hypothetical protein
MPHLLKEFFSVPMGRQRCNPDIFWVRVGYFQRLCADGAGGAQYDKFSHLQTA